MTPAQWKVMAAYAATVWAVSLWNEQFARWIVGASAFAIVLAHPELLTDPLKTIRGY